MRTFYILVDVVRTVARATTLDGWAQFGRTLRDRSAPARRGDGADQEIIRPMGVPRHYPPRRTRRTAAAPADPTAWTRAELEAWAPRPRPARRSPPRGPAH